MRLADIQSSRGLIDKAIEVNTSAIKFCKDRDQECKTELEAQKAKLIEMKLKQSIERIEKGFLVSWKTICRVLSSEIFKYNDFKTGVTCFFFQTGSMKRALQIKIINLLVRWFIASAILELFV